MGGEKKVQHLWSAIKQSANKWGMSVCVSTPQSLPTHFHTLEEYKTNKNIKQICKTMAISGVMGYK